MNRKLIIIAIASLTGGCLVGPDYHTRDVDAPERFSGDTSPTTQPASAATVDITRWWETFNDPELDRLIIRGADASLDIKLAEARVREARASLEENFATLFPTVDASGSFTRSRASKNAIGHVSVPAKQAGAVNSLLSGLSSGTSNLYQAGFDAGWEIDVFGGTRRAIESANATLEAQVEARRNATITLLSEIARNYVIVRGAQHERAAVRANIASQQDTLQLTLSKFHAGIATDLDVARQEAQVASSDSQLPTLETEIQQAIHRLGVLLDTDPDALAAELTPDAPLPVGPPHVPPGLPSELLRRRPDVKEAERRLAAASANIGVAVAELYPKFSLTGSFGIESSALKTFTNGASELWSFGPSVKWRIFDANQLLSNVKIEQARFDEAGIQYRQTILRAFQEVQDALVAYNQEQARRNALQRSVDANLRAVALAKRLNQAGVVDFLNVLTAQQALFIAQDQLAQTEQAVSTDLVALYKTLGGGWDYTEAQTPLALPETTPPPSP